jgi:hypothetical protein
MTSVSADFINSNPARATSKIQKILMHVGATSCQPEAPKYSALASDLLARLSQLVWRDCIDLGRGDQDKQRGRRGFRCRYLRK